MFIQHSSKIIIRQINYVVNLMANFVMNQDKILECISVNNTSDNEKFLLNIISYFKQYINIFIEESNYIVS
jgi:hypothetical protein